MTAKVERKYSEIMLVVIPRMKMSEINNIETIMTERRQRFQ